MSAVVDARRGHFWMNDEIMDDYAKDLGVYGFAVYAMLCRRANKDGTSHPSIQRLAEDLDISPRQAKRELKKLKELGLIAIEQRSEQNKTSLYTVLEVPQSDNNPRDSESPGDSESPDPVTVSHPKEYTEEGNNDSSLRSESANGEKISPMPEVKPEKPGAYGVRVLIEKVEAARRGGADIHDPPDVAQYGRFFATRFRRHDVERLELTLDFLVAKAAGEIDGEKKAWCGFDTALDRVIAGWRKNDSGAGTSDPDKPRSPVWYASLYETNYETVARWIKEGLGHSEIEKRLESSEATSEATSEEIGVA